MAEIDSAVKEGEDHLIAYFPFIMLNVRDFRQFLIPAVPFTRYFILPASSDRSPLYPSGS